MENARKKRRAATLASLLGMATLLIALAPTATAHPCFVDEQVGGTGYGAWICSEEVSGEDRLCIGAYEDENDDGYFQHGEGEGVCRIE